MTMIQSILDNLYLMLPNRMIWYNLDRRIQESVKVTKWLRNQLDDNALLLQNLINDNGLIGDTDDQTVINILRFVHKRIRYVSDTVQYRTVEYWATCDETWEHKKGDCEDGATLIFCLCRQAGIPNYNVTLAPMNVKDGGHCTVRYISDRYPWVIYFLDWCYYYDSKKIPRRTAYYEDKDTGTIIQPSTSRYYEYWWLTDDKNSFKW